MQFARSTVFESALGGTGQRHSRNDTALCRLVSRAADGKHAFDPILNSPTFILILLVIGVTVSRIRYMIEVPLPWLLLVASLPTSGATPRMRLWRAIKSLGCASLRDGAIFCRILMVMRAR